MAIISPLFQLFKQSQTAWLSVCVGKNAEYMEELKVMCTAAWHLVVPTGRLSPLNKRYAVAVLFVFFCTAMVASFFKFFTA